MDLKAFAKSASAFEGQMTFWILPFTTPLMEARYKRLDDLDPEVEYLNVKSGEVERQMPEKYRKALLKARDMNVPEWQSQIEYGGYRARKIWKDQHYDFLLLDTHTVDVEFALHDDAPADLRAFAAYWTECADADVIERFHAFQYAVSKRVTEAWQTAFSETRDNPAPAPAELGQEAPDEDADPNASSDGEPSTMSMSAS